MARLQETFGFHSVSAFTRQPPRSPVRLGDDQGAQAQLQRPLPARPGRPMLGPQWHIPYTLSTSCQFSRGGQLCVYSYDHRQLCRSHILPLCLQQLGLSNIYASASAALTIRMPRARLPMLCCWSTRRALLDGNKLRGTYIGSTFACERPLHLVDGSQTRRRLW